LITYEKEVNIGYNLINHLKITCILNNRFRAQKTLTKLRSTLVLPTVVL